MFVYASFLRLLYRGQTQGGPLFCVHILADNIWCLGERSIACMALDREVQKHPCDGLYIPL
jgi:hypothetical protein